MDTFGAPKYSEYCCVTDLVLKKNLTILYAHHIIATGAIKTVIIETSRIIPDCLSPTKKESPPNAPKINKHDSNPITYFIT